MDPDEMKPMMNPESDLDEINHSLQADGNGDPLRMSMKTEAGVEHSEDRYSALFAEPLLSVKMEPVDSWAEEQSMQEPRSGPLLDVKDTPGIVPETSTPGGSTHRPAKKTSTRRKRGRRLCPRPRRKASASRSTGVRAKKYGCPHCDYTSDQRSRIAQHLQKHTPNKPHVCVVCKAAFRHKTSWRRHAKRHETGTRGDGETRQYKCKTCGKAFAREDSLNGHVHRLHTNKGRYQCEHCPYSCAEKSHFVSHTRIHSGEKPFQCDQCARCFSASSSLKRHAVIHQRREGAWTRSAKGKARPAASAKAEARPAASAKAKARPTVDGVARPYKCEECREAFRSQGNLDGHVFRSHKGGRRYQCTVCPYNTWSQGYLKHHMRCHAEERPFQCDACGASYKFASSLKRHALTHAPTYAPKQEAREPVPDSELRSCPLCPKKCATLVSLKSHHYREHVATQRQCPHCPYKTGQFSHLIVHMRSHTDERPFPCTVCNKSFRTPTTMKNHTFTHLSEEERRRLAPKPKPKPRPKRSFVCPHCGVILTTAMGMRAHVERKHSGPWRYRCHVCQRACISKASLDVHLRVHTGEKPFACEECGKRFVGRDRLWRHRRRHAGVHMPYQCEICGRGSETKHTLMIHQQRHSTARPHACVICGKRFGWKLSLIKHQRLHENLDAFTCPICSEPFASASRYTSHMKNAHGVNGDIDARAHAHADADAHSQDVSQDTLAQHSDDEVEPERPKDLALDEGLIPDREKRSDI